MLRALREKIAEAKNYLRDRGQIYREVFAHPRAHYVLKDLADFTHAFEAPVVRHPRTGEIDERATFILIGRQEVWRRIQHHLNLTEDELWEIYGRSDLAEEHAEE